MTKGIDSFVRACEKCQQQNKNLEKPAASLHPVHPNSQLPLTSLTEVQGWLSLSSSAFFEKTKLNPARAETCPVHCKILQWNNMDISCKVHVPHLPGLSKTHTALQCVRQWCYRFQDYRYASLKQTGLQALYITCIQWAIVGVVILLGNTGQPCCYYY